METKLTDFTTEQLDFAILAMVEAKENASHMITKLAIAGVPMDHERIQFWEKQSDMGVLWHTQLANARLIVRNEETINAN